MAGKKMGPKGVAKRTVAAKTAAAKDVKKPVPPRATAAPAPPPAPPKCPAGPTAKMCPLVLDGEVDASDFSSGDCLTCSEFDCRFCESAQGSGALRSRLFVSDDGEDDEEEGFGGDSDFEGGGDEGLDDEGDGEEQF